MFTNPMRWQNSKVSLHSVAWPSQDVFIFLRGHDGGQVVSVHAFYYDGTSPNLVKSIIFCKIVVEKNEEKQNIFKGLCTTLSP